MQISIAQNRSLKSKDVETVVNSPWKYERNQNPESVLFKHGSTAV